VGAKALLVVAAVAVVVTALIAVRLRPGPEPEDVRQPAALAANPPAARTVLVAEEGRPLPRSPLVAGRGYLRLPRWSGPSPPSR
jgi:hypothetical protein